jgi:hypothetical protein
MTRTRWILLAIVILLVALRIALPFVVRSKINASLSKMQGYKGHVARVHLALWRGTAELRDVRIHDDLQQMHLRIPVLAVKIFWRSLAKRMVVAAIAIERPDLRLDVVGKPMVAAKRAKAKAAAEAPKKPTKPLPEMLSGMAPFRIESIRLRKGAAVVVEKSDTPGEAQPKEQKKKKAPPPRPMEAGFSDIDVSIENLTNTAKAGESLFALVKATATVLPSGRMGLGVQTDPTAKQPTFSLAAYVKGVSLPALNPLFRWQYGVDVASGTFEMFSEVRAAQGSFDGYVKPVIRGLRVTGPEKPPAGIKDALASLAAEMLKNERTGAIATKVPVKGKFSEPNIGTWSAVVGVLENAFVKALPSGFSKF